MSKKTNYTMTYGPGIAENIANVSRRMRATEGAWQRVRDQEHAAILERMEEVDTKIARMTANPPSLLTIADDVIDSLLDGETVEPPSYHALAENLRTATVELERRSAELRQANELLEKRTEEIDRADSTIEAVREELERLEKSAKWEAEERYNLEQRLRETHERAADAEDRLGAQMCAGERGPGGTFHKRRDVPREHWLLRQAPQPDHRSDAVTVLWSVAAIRAGLAHGGHEVLEGQELHALPRQVRAESWWHLCAKTGLHERWARLLYENPEEGQESAAAKAKPVQRGPAITCQGDWLEDHE